MAESEQPDVTALTVQLLSAYLANNIVAHPDLADLIRSTKLALTDGPASAAVEPVVDAPVAAVSVRKSLASNDHILSMIDGKPYKTLKRHLSSHGLTPQTYRERFNLPNDYPMVARSFTEQRRAIAAKFGLGRRPAASVKAEAPAPEPEVVMPPAEVETPAPVEPTAVAQVGKPAATSKKVKVAATPKASAKADPKPRQRKAAKGTAAATPPVEPSPEPVAVETPAQEGQTLEAAATPKRASAVTKPQRRGTRATLKLFAEAPAEPAAAPDATAASAAPAKPRVAKASTATGARKRKAATAKAPVDAAT